MANILLSFPNWADNGPLYTPTYSGGSWGPVGVGDQFPLTNLKDSRLSRSARSRSLSLYDTRWRADLGVDRQVGVIAYPLSNLSSSAKVRFLGVPSSMLFDFEAGDDIAANGGTFTRLPTTVRSATYVDSAGLVRFAGENRILQSQVMGTTWTASSVTVASDTVTAPDGTVTGDTLTATGANATLKQAVTTTAVSSVFGIWLKRKTGTGNIDVSLDGTTWVTQTIYADRWTFCWCTQTGVAGTSNPGIRIVTNGDAVYAWGARCNIGTLPDQYLPTTTVMVGAPRDGHYYTIGGLRAMLVERARTNLCLQAENFGTTWAAVGTPTRSAAAGSCGVVSLDLIGDDAAGTLEGYTQTVTFTGDAVKAISFFVRAGTSTSTVVRLRDTTASADRLLVTVTWSGGLPVITMTTGTSLGYQTLVDVSGNAVFRISVAATSVTAANTNSLQVYPATDAALSVANIGTVYIGGAQAEDATVPGTYIPTTTATVTRGVETLRFPYTAVPQAATAYVKFVQGELTNDIGLCNWAIGTTAGPNWIFRKLGSANFSTSHHNGSASVSSTVGTSVAPGDTVEARVTLASTGTVTPAFSINGGAETVGSASATNSPLNAAWGSLFIYIGGDADGLSAATWGFHSLRIMAGAQTLATLQAVVYDSGWVSSWPGSATVEDLQGINIAYVAVVPTTQTAFRYVSAQISDGANTATYIELNRLWVGPRYQPTINAAYGARLWLDDRTSFEDMDGDQSIFMAKSVRRMLDFVLEDVDESEAFTYAWRMQRRLGKSGQLFVIANPDDAVGTLLYERAFLATQVELNGVEYTAHTVYKIPNRLREVL